MVQRPISDTLMTSLGNRGREQLRDLTGDRRQLASVRSVELQDGPERGLNALVFSTGGGLDFWVLAGRSLDIGSLSWRGMPLAWQHPGGYGAASLYDSNSDEGTGIERALGGFLVTCGLDNVRQPRNGLPLHGSLPLTPARVTAYGEDWSALTPMLFAQGEVVTAHLKGACFRLARRIEAPVGGNTFRIIDHVENIGTDPTQMQILYHINFGFPAVGQGTSVHLNEAQIFTFSRARDVGVHSHQQKTASQNDRFTAVLKRPREGGWDGLEASIEGKQIDLPVFQVWRDARPRRNVLSLEPSNCARADDGTSMGGTMLKPGGEWSTSLDFRFSTPSDHFTHPGGA